MSVTDFEPAAGSIADLLLQGVYWRARDVDRRLRLVTVDTLGPRHRAAVMALLRADAANLRQQVQDAVIRAYVRGDMGEHEFSARCRELARPAVEWIEDTPLLRRLHELSYVDRRATARRRPWAR